MRNLKQYPIVWSEVESVLRAIFEEELKVSSAGSIRPVVLSMVLEFLNQHQAEFSQFLKDK